MIKKRDKVRLVRIPPWVEEMAEETQRVFQLAYGKVFRVADVTPEDLIEIELGKEIDRAMGSICNTIWVDPEDVEVIPSGKKSGSGK